LSAWSSKLCGDGIVQQAPVAAPQGKRYRLLCADVNDVVYLINRIRYECGTSIREDDAMGQKVEIEGKKLEIVKYAFDRFYENGFHATGMEAALAGSGISKRTIYKYFASKEDLIEAALRLYSEHVVDELFKPVEHIGDPKEQIIAFFDVRKTTGRTLTRGCLGMKAAQEYAGKHQGIATLGKFAASRAEVKFIELCKRAELPETTRVGKELNLVFQGALVLSHVVGDTSPFLSAKAVVAAILEKASAATRRNTTARPRH
jgi:AcrR family transcriptional regulator